MLITIENTTVSTKATAQASRKIDWGSVSLVLDRLAAKAMPKGMPPAMPSRMPSVTVKIVSFFR